MSSIAIPSGVTYTLVPATQTKKVLTGGKGGAKGDYLKALQVNVDTLGDTVVLYDGNTAINIVDATTPVGLYFLPMGIMSVSGAWSVTTTGTATAIGMGDFT